MNENTRDALLTGIIIVVLLHMCTPKAHADEVKLTPIVVWTHSSDIFKGPPFYSNPPGHEWSSDHLGFGLRADTKRFSVDLTFGARRRPDGPDVSIVEQSTELRLVWKITGGRFQ